MINKNILNKYIIIFTSVALVLLLGIFFYINLSKESNINKSTSNITNLSDISAPNGWKAERQDFSRIIFTKQDNNEFHSRIDIIASKIIDQTIENIIKDYNNNPSDQKLLSSSTVSVISSGQETIDGKLILTTIEKQTDAGADITYRIFNNGMVYSFSLRPYSVYDISTKSFVIKNTEDVQTIKTIVEDFARQLK